MMSTDQPLIPPRPPYTNYCLIALNLLSYLWELSLGVNLPQTAQSIGFVPVRLVALLHGEATFTQAVLPVFTSLFIHGNLLHLLPNVLLLFIFGGNVEYALGPGRYLFLYLAGGAGAAFIYLSFSPFSTVPLIGASGAIAAVMGAYLSLFPGSKFTTLFIMVWIFLQFSYAIYASWHHLAGQTGMAWWAHVGGFILGLVLIRLLAPDQVRLPLRRDPDKPPEH